MSGSARVVLSSCLLAFAMMFVSGCVVEAHPEGYWDRDHHRWWHNHTWVECGPADEHCR